MDSEDIIDFAKPWAELAVTAFVIGLGFVLGVKTGIALCGMI